ncbi:hypothetical protein DE146DRAFT_450015 [Phaeosphaeria sp. MPI-PUGE-AT-0046c]|nr:hypothetical protein DE146DRAFT_450015 [Phaeosphaeria sp. MPI-PUGE-AT-0046c]
MSLEAPPPSRHVSSTPISLTDASSMLETYLLNSESHPHLHPDALITPNGVSFSANGGPMGGVLLHNLRRVAAGLRGEFLEPEKTPEVEEIEDENADAYGAGKYNKKRKSVPDATTDSDWEPLAQFEAEQGGIEIGEIGDRSNFVQEGGEEPEVQTASGVQEPEKKRKKGGAGLTDKEARKQAKRERDQQRKRDNEKLRAEQAKADA